MKQNTGWVIVVVALSIMLIISLMVGAGGVFKMPAAATAAPTNTPGPTTLSPTETPDPCAPQNLPDEMARVHAFTREFDDTAQLLTNTILGDTSVPLVQDLQRIRRNAEDQKVPPCLTDLKAKQLDHMNARLAVFNTALAFFNQYGSTGDPMMPDGTTKKQDALNQQLSPFLIQEQIAAREYENEYYRLAGVTATPFPDIVIVTPTP